MTRIGRPSAAIPHWLSNGATIVVMRGRRGCAMTGTLLKVGAAAARDEDQGLARFDLLGLEFLGPRASSYSLAADWRRSATVAASIANGRSVGAAAIPPAARAGGAGTALAGCGPVRTKAVTVPIRRCRSSM